MIFLQNHRQPLNGNNKKGESGLSAQKSPFEKIPYFLFGLRLFIPFLALYGMFFMILMGCIHYLHWQPELLWVSNWIDEESKISETCSDLNSGNGIGMSQFEKSLCQKEWKQLWQQGKITFLPLFAFGIGIFLVYLDFFLFYSKIQEKIKLGPFILKAEQIQSIPIRAVANDMWGWYYGLRAFSIQSTADTALRVYFSNQKTRAETQALLTSPETLLTLVEVKMGWYGNCFFGFMEKL